MIGNFSEDEIKELAAEIAERIAGADSRDNESFQVATSLFVCPPKKLCCFEGYSCSAPFVCADGFRCPQGFGAGVIGTRG